MALSGSFYTNVGSYWRLQLEWTAKQNISGNYSDVTAKLYWIDRGSQTGVVSSASKTASITIAGSSGTASTTAGLKRNQKKLLHSRTVKVNHSSDGTGSFSISAYFDAEITLSGTKYDRISLSSRSFTLNRIPRASSITSSASWTAGNSRSVSISRASSGFTHTVRWQVQTASGSWVTVRTTTGVGTSSNGSFTTAQNTDIFNRLAQRASTPSRIQIETFSGSTQIGSTVTKTGTVTAPTASTATIANPTGVSASSGQRDSTVWIDQDIKISVSRRNSNFTHTLVFKDGNSGATVHRATGVGTSYTWTPTTSEKSQLYGKIPNGIEFDGQIDVYTYYNGVQVRSMTEKDINYRARESINKPTFSSGNISYRDINTTTTGITGNNQYIVQGKSTLRVYIDTSATAKNGATIKRYNVTANGVTKSLSSTGYVDIGVINSKSNTSVTVQAVDSRGFSTTVAKTAIIIPYTPPQITSTAKRLNDFENNTTVTAKGSFSQINIGGENKNKVTQVRYRYKQAKNLAWSDYYPFTYTSNATNGTYTATNKVLDLDNTQAWDLEVAVTDVLGTTSSVLKVRSGRPIFFIDSEKSSLGFNDFPQKENQFMLNGGIYIGASEWGEGNRGGDGALRIDGQRGKTISMNYPKGGHSYMEWSEDGRRTGYIGVPSDNATYLSISNQIVEGESGYLYLGSQTLNLRNETATYNGRPVFTSDNEILWTGAIYLQEGQRIKPSRSLTECPTGWMLVWSRYADGSANNDNWHFTYIPRAWQEARSGAGGIQIPLGSSSEHFAKYIYASSTEIWGHERNKQAPFNTRVLRFVLSY